MRRGSAAGRGSRQRYPEIGGDGAGIWPPGEATPDPAALKDLHARAEDLTVEL